MKKTGGQEYGSAAIAAGPAEGPRGRLELLMDRCTAPGQEAMVLRNGEYVAFRRRGFVYALMLNCRQAGLKEMATVEERREADILADMIKSGETPHSAFRRNRPEDRFFIASHPYSPDNIVGREYEVPENARWVRTGRGKIRFYAGNLPEHNPENNDRRRQYHAVPEGAVKVRRILSRFEWLVPDSDGYIWKKA